MPKLSQHPAVHLGVAGSCPFEFPRSSEKFLREGGKVADKDCLPKMQVLPSYFQHWPSWPWFLLFHWSVRGSSLPPPRLDPWQPPLPCCPQGPEVNHRWDGRVAEVPQNAHVATGIWGRLPRSGFVVTKGSLRGTDRIPRQLQAAPAPVLRVLVTTVMCLSNCAQEACCCLLHRCFSSLCFPLPPFHKSQLTDDSLVFPGAWGRG